MKKNKIIEWQQNETEGDSLYLLDDSENKLEIHFSTLKERIKYEKGIMEKVLNGFNKK